MHGKAPLAPSLLETVIGCDPWLIEFVYTQREEKKAVLVLSMVVLSSGKLETDIRCGTLLTKFVYTRHEKKRRSYFGLI